MNNEAPHKVCGLIVLSIIRSAWDCMSSDFIKLTLYKPLREIGFNDVYFGISTLNRLLAMLP